MRLCGEVVAYRYKRVPDNSTPEGLLRRAGRHDFGLPRVLPEHRSLPPRPGNLARPRSRAVDVGLPDGRSLLLRPSAPHSLRRVAVRVGLYLYKNRRRITRQRLMRL